LNVEGKFFRFLTRFSRGCFSFAFHRVLILYLPWLVVDMPNKTSGTFHLVGTLPSFVEY
jgi:hypothetical protein